jgi:diguanylate cyclase (GGDEF)-like protein
LALFVHILEQDHNFDHFALRKEHLRMEASLATQALKHVPMGVWVVNASSQLTWVNETLCEQLAVSAEELLGMSETEVMEKHFKVSVENSQLFRQIGVEAGVVRWYIRISQPLDDGCTANYFADASEIMRLRNENDQLNFQLENHRTTDNLTGLFNRRAIFTALEPQVSRSRRYENPLTVMTMSLESIAAESDDVDDLRDQALVTLAYFLRDQLRWVDLIGRVEDQEFLLILPETTAEDAETLALKLTERLADLVLASDPSVKLQPDVVFGISSWQKGDDTSLLMNRVRQALVKAREEKAETVAVV